MADNTLFKDASGAIRTLRARDRDGGLHYEVFTRNPVVVNEPVRFTIPSGAGPQQLPSSGPIIGMLIKALCPGGEIHIGKNLVSAATGYPMDDRETLIFEVTESNQMYVLPSGAGMQLSIVTWTRA